MRKYLSGFRKCIRKFTFIAYFFCVGESVSRNLKKMKESTVSGLRPDRSFVTVRPAFENNLSSADVARTASNDRDSSAKQGKRAQLSFHHLRQLMSLATVLSDSSSSSTNL